MLMRERSYRRERDACFGSAWGGAGWVIFFGLILILAGVTYLISVVTDVNIDFGAVFLILLGAMIIIGVLARRRL